MLCNCRNCGTFLLTAQESLLVALRLRSLMNPPTCPRCDDELRNSAFEAAGCHFCKRPVLADDGGELVQDATGADRPVHGTCMAEAEAHVFARSWEA